MLPEIKYRPGATEDARAFFKIDNLCFPKGIAFSLYTFRYHIKDPNSVIIVAEISGEIVGFSAGKVYYGGEAGIVTVDVLPDFRRRGIGGKLLSRLEAALISKSAKILVLQVAVDNEAALALYTKTGYRTTSLLLEYYPSPQRHRGSDAYLMIKNPLT